MMSVAAWVAITVLWVVVLGLVLVVLALARQIGVLHERLPQAGALRLSKGLTAGEAAPVVEVTDVNGTVHRVGAPDPQGRDRLVVFVSPTCPVCKSLLPALRAIRRREKPPIEVILASDGSRLEHLAFIAEHSLEEFTYVLSEPLGLAFGAGRLPYAVLLDGAGTVKANGLVNSREHLDSLFEARERGVATLQDYLGQQRDVA